MCHANSFTVPSWPDLPGSVDRGVLAPAAKGLRARVGDDAASAHSGRCRRQGIDASHGSLEPGHRPSAAPPPHPALREPKMIGVRCPPSHKDQTLMCPDVPFYRPRHRHRQDLVPPSAPRTPKERQIGIVPDELIKFSSELADEPLAYDTTVAHPARVYNYWLGGKDNFEADREVGEQTKAAYPISSAACRPSALSSTGAIW